MSLDSQYELRAPKLNDLPTLVSYWHDYPEDYYRSLGIDRNLVPAANLKSMQSIFESAPEYFENFYRVVIFENKNIANVMLRFEEGFSLGEMHFHIFKKKKRQKGAGKIIYKMALEYFFSFENVDAIMMQPLADNIPANKLLQSLGLDLKEQYTQQASGASLGGLVNKYVISKEDFSNWE